MQFGPKAPPPISEGENQPGTPQLLRTLNERAILDLLRRNGPASRPQLAQQTGLSKPTVAAALANLERARLVRAAGQSSPGRGRLAVLYESNPTVGYVVGVDVGQSWLRCAVADLAGTIVARRDVRNTARSAGTLVRMVSHQAREITRVAGLDWNQVVQTVVGSPGVFDPQDGRLLLASRIRRWGRPGLLEDLRSELGEDTLVLNDANLAAIGERSFGCGVTVGTFVYLMVGTGVGMGIVIDGKLHAGARGAAGEVAYLPVGSGGPQRAVTGFGGRWGQLEEIASAQGVVRTAVELGMSPRLSAKKIFDAARRGDPMALTAVEREAERLALVVAAVAAVLDPEVVVLGGGVGHNLELLNDPLERRLHQLTPFRPRIAASELGDEAVLLGAIASALDVARDQVFQARTEERRISASA